MENISEYFEELSKNISNILLRHQKNKPTYDILDTEKTLSNKMIALKEKQRLMKIGEIWQEAIGKYDGFISLKNGDETGLDILSHSKKIAIELKNRTNTDNASSRKTNLNKLAKFKRKHPDYICIYANINANTKEGTIRGSKKIIIHGGVEIEHHIGFKFLNFIFGDDTEAIVEFIRNEISRF